MVVARVAVNGIAAALTADRVVVGTAPERVLPGPLGLTAAARPAGRAAW